MGAYFEGERREERMGRKATGRESPPQVNVSRINTELVGKRKHTDGRTRTIAVYARAQTQSVEFSVVERLSRCLSACRYKTANYLRLGAMLQSALKKTGQFLGGGRSIVAARMSHAPAPI